MWRGWNKFSDDYFEKMASIPSSFPESSGAGLIPLQSADGKGSSPYALVLDDIVPEYLIQALLGRATEEGFAEALLNTGDVNQEKGVSNRYSRQSKRAIFHCDTLAVALWNLLRDHMPAPATVPGPRWKGWRPVGVNPCLRVLQYDETGS